MFLEMQLFHAPSTPNDYTKDHLIGSSWLLALSTFTFTNHSQPNINSPYTEKN